MMEIKKYLVGIDKPYYPSIMSIPDKDIAQVIFDNIKNTDGLPVRAYLAEIIEMKEVK